MNIASVCPKCGQSDKIEKVSAIVKKETRIRKDTRWIEDTYKDNKGIEQTISYPLTRDVIEISDLAKELLPPEKPKAQGGGCFADMAVAILLGLFAIYWLVGGLRVETFTLEGLGIVACFVLIFGGGAALLASRYLRASAEARKSREQVHNVEIPSWNNAMEKWDEAYYCYRDGIVFIPNGKWVSSSKMSSLLYEPEARA